MNLVKLRFLRGGEPQGREYTYSSKQKVEVGDIVVVREPDSPGAEAPKGIITMVDVPESEIEKFKDRLKEIVGKAGECLVETENEIQYQKGETYDVK